MSENLQAVYRRIQKLLAIANDTRANPAEAAAAASQAEKVMRHYQIGESDVLEKEFRSGSAGLFGTADVSASFNLADKINNSHKAVNTTAVCIAKLNDCQAIFLQDPTFGKMIRFRGFKPDVMVCKFTFFYIVKACLRASKKESHDFREGYMTAIRESLNRALTEKQAEMQGAVNSRALVIVKKDAVSLHFGEVNYGQVRTNIHDANAAARGYAEGKKLDVLLRGVGHTAPPARKQLT